MSVEVRPVTSRRELVEFVELPFRLHSNQPAWVPPLRLERRLFLMPSQNAFFSHGAAQLFLAERDGRVVGCVAIVAADAATVQLRWFLVEPSARRLGLGRRLGHEAVWSCKQCGYESVFLWTVSALTAARLSGSAGFEKVAERAGKQWGVNSVQRLVSPGRGKKGRPSVPGSRPHCLTGANVNPTLSA